MRCQGSYDERIYFNDASLLYPNPVSDALQLLVGGQPQVQLSVYDVKGNKFYAGEYQVDPYDRAISLDVGHFPPGNYIVHLETKQQLETLKFIKQ